MIEIDRDNIENIVPLIKDMGRDVSFLIDDIVKLSGTEYVKLIQKYGTAVVNKKIIACSTYEHNRKKRYRDYYRTIDNWCRQDSATPSKLF